MLGSEVNVLEVVLANTATEVVAAASVVRVVVVRVVVVPVATRFGRQARVLRGSVVTATAEKSVDTFMKVPLEVVAVAGIMGIVAGVMAEVGVVRAAAVEGRVGVVAVAAVVGVVE